jgi:ATP-binding cassette subfamily C exporter for protease/lipase
MKAKGQMNSKLKRPKDETLLTATLRLAGPAIGFAALFSLIVNLLFLALPLYTTQVYSRVLSSGSIPTLIVLTVGAIFVFAVSAVIDFLQSRILASIGIMIDQRVSGHIFAALFDGIVKREPQAGSQALRDLDAFRQTITGTGISVIFDLPWIPIYMIILIVIDPLIGLVSLLGGLTLLLLAFLQDRFARPLILDGNAAMARSYAFTEAGLRNAEVVRAMGMLEPIGKQWSVFRLAGISNNIKAARVADFWGDLIKLVRNIVQVAVIAVGAFLIINKDIGPGLLFANMILSARALAPIDRVVGTWAALVAAANSYGRLNELLKDYKPPAQALELPRPLGQLNVEGLNYAIPGSGRLLLTNIQFALAPGEFLGVIGPSGAGKSTLARLLVGVYPALNGVVRLDGSDVFGWARSNFGQYVGYLPQDTELFAGTVRENISRFQIGVTDEEVIEAATKACAHDIIVRLANGYETELGQGGTVLSVGQRQRIGLARAMLRSPSLVVLDEPNANLDAEGELALLRALEQMKASGQTVIVVSHKPSILRGADKLLVLREGRIELYGPREVVLERMKPARPEAVNPPVANATQPAEATQ